MLRCLIIDKKGDYEYNCDTLVGGISRRRVVRALPGPDDAHAAEGVRGAHPFSLYNLAQPNTRESIKIERSVCSTAPVRVSISGHNLLAGKSQQQQGATRMWRGSGSMWKSNSRPAGCVPIMMAPHNPAIDGPVQKPSFPSEDAIHGPTAAPATDEPAAFASEDDIHCG